MIRLNNYDKEKLYPPDKTSPPSYRIKKTKLGYKVQQKFFLFWIDLTFVGREVLTDRHFQTFSDAEFGLRVAQI